MFLESLKMNISGKQRFEAEKMKLSSKILETVLPLHELNMVVEFQCLDDPKPHSLQNDPRDLSSQGLKCPW